MGDIAFHHGAVVNGILFAHLENAVVELTN